MGNCHPYANTVLAPSRPARAVLPTRLTYSNRNQELRWRKKKQLAIKLHFEHIT